MISLGFKLSPPEHFNVPLPQCRLPFFSSRRDSRSRDLLVVHGFTGEAMFFQDIARNCLVLQEIPETYSAFSTNFITVSSEH